MDPYDRRVFEILKKIVILHIIGFVDFHQQISCAFFSFVWFVLCVCVCFCM